MTTPKPETPALLPCPFCGGAARYAVGSHDYGEDHTVLCDATYECATIESSNKERAVAAWNTRAALKAAPSARDAALEEAAKVCDAYAAQLAELGQQMGASFSEASIIALSQIQALETAALRIRALKGKPL